MPILPGTDKIGDWNVTRLAKFIADYIKQHPLPVADNVKAYADDSVSTLGAKVSGLVTGVSSVFGRTGAVTAQSGDYSVAQVTGAAPTASPTFTGTPVAPTPGAGDSSTKLATTAFVGSAVAASPGSEIAYNSITATVTVGAVDTSVIAGTTVTYDGTPIEIEVFLPDVLLPSVAGGTVNITLFDGSTQVVILAVLTNAAAVSVRNPATLKWRLTPSAGSHTYNVHAVASVTTGTPAIQAGTGTVSSGLPPAYTRITKV